MKQIKIPNQTHASFPYCDKSQRKEETEGKRKESIGFSVQWSLGWSNLSLTIDFSC